MDEVLRLWGKNIATFRGARDLGQAELAEALGVTAATVSRWEAGLIEPRRNMKVRIAQVLGTDVSVLFPLTRGAVA